MTLWHRREGDNQGRRIEGESNRWPSAKPCPGSTVFVWMTGIEEFHQQLAAKNYKYLRPGLETTFYDAKCVQVIDPFGNRIRFNEDLKPAKTT